MAEKLTEKMAESPEEELLEKEKKEKIIRHMIWYDFQLLEMPDECERKRNLWRFCMQFGHDPKEYNLVKEIPGNYLDPLQIRNRIGMLKKELLLLKGMEEEAERLSTLSYEEIMELRNEFGLKVKVKVEVEEKTKERQIYDDIWNGRRSPLTLTEEEKILYRIGTEQKYAEQGICPPPALPLPPVLTIPPAPWDTRKSVPLTRKLLQKFFEELQTAPSSSTTSVISGEDRREKLAAEGRCLDRSYLTPYCMCGDGVSPAVFEASYSPAPNFLVRFVHIIVLTLTTILVRLLVPQYCH